MTDTPKYATTAMLASLLGIRREIPALEASTPPAREEIGTGNGSTALFYTSQRRIIAGTYAFYTGDVTETTATTALTETTDFTLDKTRGALTLTTAGKAKVGTNKIFGQYAYLDPAFGLSDDDLAAILVRGEARVDNMVQTTFVAEATNPAYPLVLREMQPSKGWFDRNYFSWNRPIYDVSSALGSDLAKDATTLAVTTGDGAKFPTAGFVIIDSEVIQYTGVTGDTLTGLARAALSSAAAAAHSAGATIHTTIVESSSTPEGIPASYVPLSYRDLVNVDAQVGKVQVFQNASLAPDYIASNLHRFSDIADRFRITYFWGVTGVPRDIERLALLVAKQELMRDVVGKAIVAGRGEFGLFNTPDIDNKEIRDIVANYKQLLMGNV